MKIPFNVNEYVKVKLTNKGKAILRRKHDSLFNNRPYTPLKEDSEGYVRMQMWSFMECFSNSLSLTEDLPFDPSIIILTKGKYEDE